MDQDPEALKRKLDEVVGDRYDERGNPGLARWIGRSLPKWIAGIALGIAAAVVVFLVLDRHIIAAHQRAADAPRKPVTIQIVPAKPAIP